MITLIWGLILGASLTIFSLQNADIASLNFLAWQFSAPLAITIMAVSGLSVIATLLAVVPTLFRYETQIQDLRREKKAFADELGKYSITMPIAPPERAPAGLPVWPAERQTVEVRR